MKLRLPHQLKSALLRASFLVAIATTVTMTSASSLSSDTFSMEFYNSSIVADLSVARAGSLAAIAPRASGSQTWGIAGEGAMGKNNVIDVPIANLNDLDLTVQGNENWIFSGAGSITGASSLKKTGAGSLTIKKANAYTAGTTLEEGILNANHADALGTGLVTVKGGTLNAARALNLTGGLTVSGGTANLLSGGTLVGTVNAQGGTLNLGGTWAGDFTFNGGNLVVKEGLVFNGKVTMATATLTVKCAGSASNIFKGGYDLTNRNASWVFDVGAGQTFDFDVALDYYYTSAPKSPGALTVLSGTAIMNTAFFNPPVVNIEQGAELFLNKMDASTVVGNSKININGGTFRFHTDTSNYLWQANGAVFNMTKAGSQMIGMGKGVFNIRENTTINVLAAGSGALIYSEGGLQLSNGTATTAQIWTFNVEDGAEDADLTIKTQRIFQAQDCSAFKFIKKGAGTLRIETEQLGNVGNQADGGLMNFNVQAGSLEFAGSASYGEVNYVNIAAGANVYLLGKGLENTIDKGSSFLGAGNLYTERKLFINVANGVNSEIFSGTLFVQDGGSVVLGHVDAVGTGTISLIGGEVDVNNFAFAGKIHVAEGQSGSFTNGASYVGGLQVDGSLTLSGANLASIGGAGVASLSGIGTLNLTGADTQFVRNMMGSFSGNISVLGAGNSILINDILYKALGGSERFLGVLDENIFVQTVGKILVDSDQTFDDFITRAENGYAAGYIHGSPDSTYTLGQEELDKLNTNDSDVMVGSGTLEIAGGTVDGFLVLYTTGDGSTGQLHITGDTTLSGLFSTDQIGTEGEMPILGDFGKGGSDTLITIDEGSTLTIGSGRYNGSILGEGNLSLTGDVYLGGKIDLTGSLTVSGVGSTPATSRVKDLNLTGTAQLNLADGAILEVSNSASFEIDTQLLGTGTLSIAAGATLTIAKPQFSTNVSLNLAKGSDSTAGGTLDLGSEGKYSFAGLSGGGTLASSKSTKSSGSITLDVSSGKNPIFDGVLTTNDPGAAQGDVVGTIIKKGAGTQTLAAKSDDKKVVYNIEVCEGILELDGSTGYGHVVLKTPPVVTTLRLAGEALAAPTSILHVKANDAHTFYSLNMETGSLLKLDRPATGNTYLSLTGTGLAGNVAWGTFSSGSIVEATLSGSATLIQATGGLLKGVDQIKFDLNLGLLSAGLNVTLLDAATYQASNGQELTEEQWADLVNNVSLAGDIWGNLETKLIDGKLVLQGVRNKAGSPFEGTTNSSVSKVGADLIWDATEDYLKENGTELSDSGTELGDVLNSITEMGLGSAGTNNLLAAIAGSTVTALAGSQRDDYRQQQEWIRNRTVGMGSHLALGDKFSKPSFNAWIQANAGTSKVDQKGHEAGYTLDTFGGTVGFDVTMSPKLIWGLAFTANYNDLKATGAESATGNNDAYYANLFLRSQSTTRWANTLILTAGWNDASLDRTVAHSLGQYTAKGETKGSTIGAMYETTYDIALNENKTRIFQPLFNLSFVNASMDAYRETGAGNAGLAVDSTDANYGSVSLGARLMGEVGSKLFGRASVGELRLQVAQDFGDEANIARVGFGGIQREVVGAKVGKTGFQVGAGISVPVSQKSSVYVDVNSDFRNNATNVNGSIGYRINF